MNIVGEVYGRTAVEPAQNDDFSDTHQRDVIDVLATMPEIKVVLLRKRLEGGPNCIQLTHPVTGSIVAVTLSDIRRRNEMYHPPPQRSNLRQPADYIRLIYERSVSENWTDKIRRWAQSSSPNVEGETESASEVSRKRRRCLIASALLFALLLVIAVVVVVVVVVNDPNNKVTCGDVEFKCSDGKMCIALSKRCDGTDDCGDSSDERSCTTTTPTTTTSTTTITTTTTASRSTITTPTRTSTSTTTTTSTPTTTTPPTTPVGHRCILLIGGYTVSSPLVEYYHPTMMECDRDAIGTMATNGIDRSPTSGCYLSATQQIVVRERGEQPPMLYGLGDSTAQALPLLPNGFTAGSTAASVDPSKCLSCGGWAGDRRLKECYQFDSLSPTNWTSIASLPIGLSYLASVSMVNDNSFYIIAGKIDTGLQSNQLWRYSMDERRWSNETSMPKGRWSVVLSDTEFIVCGGDKNRNDCEVYNTIRKSWRRVGNLTVGRKDFAMTTFNGTVYALGGKNGGFVNLNSVEAYDAQTEEWTVVKKLKYRRDYFVALVV